MVLGLEMPATARSPRHIQPRLVGRAPALHRRRLDTHVVPRHVETRRATGETVAGHTTRETPIHKTYS